MWSNGNSLNGGQSVSTGGTVMRNGRDVTEPYWWFPPVIARLGR